MEFLRTENISNRSGHKMQQEDISYNAGLKYLPKWPSVNIDFKELVYSVPDLNSVGRKTLIRNVTGQFRSNELTAILGPSGSGKSTLLNLLAGFRIAHDSGQIYVNGNPRKMKLFKKISRYIMQDEELDEFATVREAMMLSANLKLGNQLKFEEKNEVIDEILDNLRLKKVENTMSTKLSGGEKKRLSIAMELLNNPPVIFLDEPTTGLDNLSSNQCIAMLKRIANGGRTIICSIHTPSAKLFESFDNIYVLAAGQCVYQGSRNEIIPFVKSIGLTCPITYNPADFIIEVASCEYGKEYRDEMVIAVENGKCIKWMPYGSDYMILDEPKKDLLKQQIKMNDIEWDLKNFKTGANWWETFHILLIRMFMRMWRDKTYIKMKFIMHMVLVLIVGGIYQKTGTDATKALFNYGFAFAVMFSYVYLPLMPVLAAFPKELRLVRREYFNQWYPLGAYYCAMMCSKVPFMFFTGSIYITSIYFMSSQPPEFDRFIKVFSIALVTGLVSDSFGVIIGSRFNIVNGQFVGPVLISPMMLLSGYGFGFGINKISIFMKIAMNICYLRHSLVGIMAALYGNNRGDTECPETEIICLLRKTQFFLRMIGLEHADYASSLLSLIGFYIVFSVAGYLMIKHRLSISQMNFVVFQYLDQFLRRHFNFSSY